MSDQLLVAVFGAAIASAVAAVVLIEKFSQGKRKRSSPDEEIWKSSSTESYSKEDNAQIRRRFNNVFAMMSADRRQKLVEYYQRSHGCDITTAMQMAIDDLRNEQERYR